jgi:4-hydroxy-tetrahydrodipicolinate synthase
MIWEGIYPALWTPMNESGNLELEDLKRQINFLRHHRVHGIFALGSTGEFPHLDLPERRQLIEAAVPIAEDLPVIVNISDIRPRVTAELGKIAKAAGAAAVAVLPPFYFQLSQDDLVEFFIHAGRAAELPVFLYNFPERTGNRIQLETIAAVASEIHVAGVKQSGADFEYHRCLAELGAKLNFTVFSGSDTRLAEAMAMGASGCVSGLANGVPELMVEAFNDARRSSGSGKAADQLNQIGALVDQLEFPINMAALLEARGFDPGAPKSLRAPSTQRKYALLVQELREHFAHWQLA